MSFSDLPILNTCFNFISIIFLTFGYINIKKGKQEIHRKCMIGAMISSGFFLTSYLIYHYQVGSVPYPYYDWTRTLYFTILIPHVIMAALTVPFIIRLIYLAVKERFDQHQKLARFVWPTWMFVAVSGIIVFFMLYVF